MNYCNLDSWVQEELEMTLSYFTTNRTCLTDLQIFLSVKPRTPSPDAYGETLHLSPRVNDLIGELHKLLSDASTYLTPGLVIRCHIQSQMPYLLPENCPDIVNDWGTGRQVNRLANILETHYPSVTYKEWRRYLGLDTGMSRKRALEVATALQMDADTTARLLLSSGHDDRLDAEQNPLTDAAVLKVFSNYLYQMYPAFYDKNSQLKHVRMQEEFPNLYDLFHAMTAELGWQYDRYEFSADPLKYSIYKTLHPYPQRANRFMRSMKENGIAAGFGRRDILLLAYFYIKGYLEGKEMDPVFSDGAVYTGFSAVLFEIHKKLKIHQAYENELREALSYNLRPDPVPQIFSRRFTLVTDCINLLLQQISCRPLCFSCPWDRFIVHTLFFTDLIMNGKTKPLPIPDNQQEILYQMVCTVYSFCEENTDLYPFLKQSFTKLGWQNRDITDIQFLLWKFGEAETIYRKNASCRFYGTRGTLSQKEKDSINTFSVKRREILLICYLLICLCMESPRPPECFYSHGNKLNALKELPTEAEKTERLLEAYKYLLEWFGEDLPEEEYLTEVILHPSQQSRENFIHYLFQNKY